MTLEEMQNKIIEITEENRLLKDDKTSLETKLTEIQDKYTNVEETSNKRIQELQEHNQKLFLRVSHQKANDRLPSKETTSKLLGSYADLLDENELELLKDIEGGL